MKNLSRYTKKLIRSVKSRNNKKFLEQVNAEDIAELEIAIEELSLYGNICIGRELSNLLKKEQVKAIVKMIIAGLFLAVEGYVIIVVLLGLGNLIGLN